MPCPSIAILGAMYLSLRRRFPMNVSTGTPKKIRAKKQKNANGAQAAAKEAIASPRLKAGGVTIEVAGIYVLGKEAPNVYCSDAEAFGFDQVYVTRPSKSIPVCGSGGNPAGALCQRGSSG